MKLQSSRFGELTISEEDIFTFPRGIPGFEERKSYVILAPEANEPFAFLQAVEDEHLGFIVIDPFLFFPDYDFEIPESALAELRIASREQVLVRAIITVRDKLEDATVNLVAPVIFNIEERLGRQIVLEKTPYLTKHPLFAATAND